jgi:predicted secreted protein
MSWPIAIALYFVIWWVTLFAVLPIGLKTQEEAGDVVPGTPEGAPSAFRALRVVVINTIVATTVFAIVWVVIRYNLIGLPDVPGIVPQGPK